jgi:hypothetical protein
MEIGDEVKTVVVNLQLDVLLDGSEVIPPMKPTSRLYAAEYSHVAR